MNKKRIAFCFSGQARTLDQTYPLFKKNLFDTAQEQWFDFDVFCAVEDDQDLEKVELLQPLQVEKIKSNDVSRLIRQKYSDFKMLHKNIYILYNYHPNLLHKSLTNYLQQYYKVKRSIELKHNFEIDHSFTYDLVVRLRFDYWLLIPLDFTKILADLGENTILCQQLTHRHFTLCSIADFFFLGDSPSMDILAQHFDHFMDSFVGHYIHPLFKPILWLLRWLDMINFKLNNFFLTNHLLRILAIITTKFFFDCYCAELIVYNYLQYHNIHILRDTFSFRIVRSKGKDMVFSFEKSKYQYINSLF